MPHTAVVTNPMYAQDGRYVAVPGMSTTARLTPGRAGTGTYMRLGVLDIGSNAAQLQIVDLAAGSPPLPAHAVKNPTLLSDEITEAGAITPNGIERVSSAVSDAVQVAGQQHVNQLYPFVTAVIRDAANREQVLDQIEAAAGVRPQFLTGEQEARLTYLAVHRWYGWSAGRLLLLDIGGASMEVALGRDAMPQLAISLPLGARRLTDQFLASDPPTRKQIKAARRHIRDTLGEVADRLRWEAEPRRVVATSKTFKQLGRLAGAAPQRKGPFVRRMVFGRHPQLDTVPRQSSREEACEIAGHLVATGTADPGRCPRRRDHDGGPRRGVDGSLPVGAARRNHAAPPGSAGGRNRSPAVSAGARPEQGRAGLRDHASERRGQ